MKKVVMSIALAAFIGSFTTNTYAQDGEKKVNRTEKKKKCDKKSCCSRDKNKEEKKEDKKK